MAVDSRELENRIAFEALDPAFRIVHKDALSNTLVPLIVIVVMWSRIDHILLLGWGLLMIAGIGAKYLVATAYLRQDVAYTDVNKWGTRLAWCVAYFSVLWSSSVFLFHVDGSVVHQVFLYTWIFAMSTGSLIAGIYWLPLYFLFAPPLQAALAIRLAMEGTLAHIALAGMILFGSLALLSFARLLNSTVRSEMRLRHQSAALAEALQAKTEEAQQATLAKTRFLAAASHDLRQPLHALSLFVDVLKEAKSDDERANVFSRIELSLDALRKLFDALLDVSRLDAKAVKPEFSHFDTAELLKSLAEEFRFAAREKNLRLRIHARSLTVASDRVLLERVLRNLVSNAIRYTESGGVLLSARARGDKVLLQVFDTGTGIPEESRDEVFVEFRQLHNAHRDRSQGLGLGLAIVRRLCHLLNLALELDSIPGKGSIFSVRVPRGDPRLLVNRQSVARTHSWDLNGRIVLVIDDERDILDAMQAMLSKWGCEVVIAESLKDAVDGLNRRRITPDLILSDLRLRDGVMGTDAIDCLRKEFGASIPGILITGDTAADRMEMAQTSGYEVLQKPVRPAHLRTVIQHQLSDAER